MSSKIALAVAAHPDDIEFLMSGTLLRLADAGYSIHYWNLANGCCGSDCMDREETARVRRLESIHSCQKLAATFHDPICDDLSIFFDRETLARATSVIRQIEPEIVLTHSLSDYMEDHMNTARLAVTATFSRGMKNFPVDPPQTISRQDVCLYHAQPYSNLTPMRQLVVPDLFVDTTDLMEKKKELLACHASQKEWLDVSQGLDSYLATLESLDRQVGEMSGRFEFAEGWRQHLHLGFASEADNFLHDALAGESLNGGSKEDRPVVFFED